MTDLAGTAADTAGRGLHSAITICPGNSTALSTNELMTLLLVQAWGQHLQSKSTSQYCAAGNASAAAGPCSLPSRQVSAKHQCSWQVCWCWEQPAPARCSSATTAVHSMNSDGWQQLCEDGGAVTNAGCAENVSKGCMQEIPELGTHIGMILLTSQHLAAWGERDLLRKVTARPRALGRVTLSSKSLRQPCWAHPCLPGGPAHMSPPP